MRADPPAISIGDLTRLRWVDQPRPNPSGTHIAYTELWLDKAADGPGATVVICDQEGRTLVRIQLPGRRTVGLSWSPNGRRLAVAADELLVVAIYAGGPRVVTTVPGLGAVRVDWSPDEQHWAVEVDHGGEPGIHLLDTADPAAAPTAVLPGGTHPVWTTTGALAARRDVDGISRLVSVDAHGSTRTLSAAGRQVLALTATHAGRRLAYLDRAADRLDAPPELQWLDLTTGRGTTMPAPARGTIGITVQSDDPRGVEPQLAWSPSTGRVYAYETVGGAGPLRWFDDEGRTGTVLAGDGVALSPGCSDTGLVLAVRTDPTDPGEVWSVDERTGRSDRLTRTNAWLSGAAVAAQALELDGAAGPLDGWLWEPPDPVARPLVVSVHGGPYYASGLRFGFEVQRLVSLGYRVLTLNPRGSAGRDAAFTHAIAGDWGGPDADDVESAVRGLVERHPAGDVVVTGVSYGGFLAQLLLSRTRLFRGAISENGISDFALLHSGNARQRATAEWAMGGPPGSTDHYADRSPRHRVSSIVAPLLLIHAEDDRTCPLAQSLSMRDTLAAAGRTVELVTLPDEGHLVNLDGRPSSRHRRARAVDDWLRAVVPHPR